MNGWLFPRALSSAVQVVYQTLNFLDIQATFPYVLHLLLYLSEDANQPRFFGNFLLFPGLRLLLWTSASSSAVLFVSSSVLPLAKHSDLPMNMFCAHQNLVLLVLRVCSHEKWDRGAQFLDLREQWFPPPPRLPCGPPRTALTLASPDYRQVPLATRGPLLPLCLGFLLAPLLPISVSFSHLLCL